MTLQTFPASFTAKRKAICSSVLRSGTTGFGDSESAPMRSRSCLALRRRNRFATANARFSRIFTPRSSFRSPQEIVRTAARPMQGDTHPLISVPTLCATAARGCFSVEMPPDSLDSALK